MSNIFRDRIKRLRNLLSLSKKDVYFTYKTEDVIYLTGFSSSNAFLFISGSYVKVFTDKRYTQQIKTYSGEIEFQIFNDHWIDEIKKFLKSKKVKRLFIEASKISYDRYLLFQKSFNTELKLLPNSLEFFFAFQDEYGINQTKKALKFTEKIFLKILEYVKEGITELDLYAELKYQINLIDAKSEAFDPIVLFGKNTAYPHGKTGKTKLKPHSPIILDFGVKFNGYNSDFTRTIYFGKPSQEFRKYYEIVNNALSFVKSKINVGLKGHELYECVIKYFAGFKLDNFFTHALGHGLGVYIHNYPRIARNSKDIILPNLIIAIEPALYFENVFGIRIENNFLVNDNKVDVLNTVTTNLITI